MPRGAGSSPQRRQRASTRPASHVHEGRGIHATWQVCPHEHEQGVDPLQPPVGWRGEEQAAPNPLPWGLPPALPALQLPLGASGSDSRSMLVALAAVLRFPAADHRQVFPPVGGNISRGDGWLRGCCSGAALEPDQRPPFLLFPSTQQRAGLRERLARKLQTSERALTRKG